MGPLAILYILLTITTACSSFSTEEEEDCLHVYTERWYLLERIEFATLLLNFFAND